jgi:glycerophosphoryl diester phosphodiesterase
MSRPLLLGHRGARAVKSIPENSIASFDRCLADGCDGFEFDVRLTADAQAVVCHNPRFERCVIAQSQARSLTKLATFGEVLKRYQTSAFLDIELKVPGIERITSDFLKRHPPQRGFVVSSFLGEVLQALHDVDPAIPQGLICETKAQLRGWQQLPIDYLIVHQKLVTPELIEDAHKLGRKFLVWTVNAARDMRRLGALGVDGIISDDTSLLSRTLSKKRKTTELE